MNINGENMIYSNNESKRCTKDGLNSFNIEGTNNSLTEELQSGEIKVSPDIIYEWGQSKFTKAVPLLKNSLKNSNADIRWATVEALEKIAVEKKIDVDEIAPTLIEWLKKESIPEIRAAINRTLGNFNTQQISTTLINYAMCDSDRFVRKSAIKALENIAKRNSNEDKENINKDKKATPEKQKTNSLNQKISLEITSDIENSDLKKRVQNLIDSNFKEKGGTILGICGGSGAGKTTLATHLQEYIRSIDSIIINHDRYYRQIHDRVNLYSSKSTSIDPLTISYNFDEPDSLETDLLVKHLNELKSGNNIRIPVYSYKDHKRLVDQEDHQFPRSLIIIEGVLILHDKKLRDLLDFSIFIDTDADERLMRRTIRDIRERGRQYSDVFIQYRNTVKPSHELYVEKNRHYADKQVKGNEPFNKDIINSILEEFADKLEC